MSVDVLDTRSRSLLAGIFIAGSLFSARVSAGPAEDRAAADALFREGRGLVKQGKFADACPKLAASQKLDPAVGTLLALGDCYELAGQTASAWATFNDAGAMARKASDQRRAEEAARRAGLLEQKLTKLTVEVAPDARVDGLEVKRNGRVIDPVLLGSAIPIDPGEQTIEATAPNKQAWSAKVQVEAKPGVITVRVPALAAVAAPAAPKPPDAMKPEPAKLAPEAPKQAPPAEAPPEAPPSFWNAQRGAGLAVAGVGLVGVVIGTIAGVAVLRKMGDIEDTHACSDDNPPRCTSDGLAAQHGANNTANVANAMFAIGGAALVAGVVVFATAGSRKAPKAAAARVELQTVVGSGTSGLTLRGAW